MVMGREVIADTGIWTAKKRYILNVHDNEGVRYAEPSGSAVCTPTRYGIMTGRYSWRTTLQSGVVSGFKPNLIKEDRPTIGNFLKNQGYNTAIIGKWHLNFQYVDSISKKTIRKKGRKLPPVGSLIPDGPIFRYICTKSRTN